MTESTQKRRVLVFITQAALLAALLASPAYFFNPRGAQAPARAPAQAEETESEEESIAPEAAPPGEALAPAAPSNIVVSQAPADVELGRNIAQAIEEGGFASARWGIYVASLRDGRVLYAREADRLFVPASNMKLYSTAPALDLLGADYRWRTSVYAEREPDAGGVIMGDLVLYGRGAPDLTARRVRRGQARPQLAELAEALYARGVRRVRGRVVGDESYFRGNALGDGWLWQDVQWYFGAEPSALTVDDNEIRLTITPAERAGEPATLQVIPQTDYIRLINDTNTAARGARLTIGVTRGLSDNEVRVWGEFPAGGGEYSVRLAVHRPALWAAQMFRAALRARGITIEGEAAARDARVRPGERFEPAGAVELAFVQSTTLGEIARVTNKESVNLYAELLLRTIGKERGAEAPDPNPLRMQLRGDDEAGLAVLRQWLARNNVPLGQMALRDGSGLSRLNLITPEATARMLAYMTGSAAAAPFRESLPIAGRDGTLRGRLRGAQAADRVFAKTGTLAYVRALSGYVTAADGEPLVFSIICNDDTMRVSAARAIDTMVTRLAAYRSSDQAGSR